jgi:aminoglycoside 6'-N-acetyltransferase
VYERLGFRPVGVLRQYERVAGGSRRDALLMELLAAELVRG